MRSTSRLMRHLQPTLDPTKPDPKMAIRARKGRAIIPTTIVAILATIVVPFGMQNTPIADYCVQMAITMAIGMAIAGLWGVIELLWPDPVTNKKPEDRTNSMLKAGLAAAFLAVVMFLLSWLVATLGSSSWFSYTLLKSLGLVSYVIGGLLPVIAYGLTTYAVATRQIVTSTRWRVVAIIGLAVSLLATWFWAGYRLYLDYHVV